MLRYNVLLLQEILATQSASVLYLRTVRRIHVYSLWEQLYKWSAIIIRQYCTLLGVILHVAKADIALLIETMYIVRLTINRVQYGINSTHD